MLYRGIEYSVVQGIVRHHWKWAATVSGTKISGYGSTRDEAIDNAEKAIERAIQKQRFKQDLGGRSMTVSSSTAARAALAFVLIAVGGAAVAQGAPPAKKPTVGGRPIVQAKPSTPMGCKLVGTVKGTKIWAGDCVGASELRGATPAEELSSPPAVAPSEKQ
jgi:hypothetical protein